MKYLDNLTTFVKDSLPQINKTMTIMVTGLPEAGKTVYCGRVLNILVDTMKENSNLGYNFSLDESLKNSVKTTQNVLSCGVWPNRTESAVDGQARLILANRSHSFSLMDFPGESLVEIFGNKAPTQNQEQPEMDKASEAFKRKLRSANGVLALIDSAQLLDGGPHSSGRGDLDDIFFKFFSFLTANSSSVQRIGLVLTKIDLYRPGNEDRLKNSEPLLADLLHYSFPQLREWARTRSGAQFKIFLVSAAPSRIDDEGNEVPQKTGLNDKDAHSGNIDLLEPLLWVLDIPQDKIFPEPAPAS